MLLCWLFTELVAFMGRMKYAIRLSRLENKVADISLTKLDTEMSRLKSESQTLFERLGETHRIHDAPATKPISDFVQAEADYQKKRRRKSQSPKPKRRSWKYN
jgi:hypothetical protein